MRLTWSREPREHGLAGVCQGIRGWRLKAGGEIIGHVSPLYRCGPHSEQIGWYWFARAGEAFRNTAAERRVLGADEAKSECKAWVIERMRKEPR